MISYYVDFMKYILSSKNSEGQKVCDIEWLASFNTCDLLKKVKKQLKALTVCWILEVQTFYVPVWLRETDTRRTKATWMWKLFRVANGRNLSNPSPEPYTRLLIIAIKKRNQRFWPLYNRKSMIDTSSWYYFVLTLNVGSLELYELLYYW